MKKYVTTILFFIVVIMCATICATAVEWEGRSVSEISYTGEFGEQIDELTGGKKISASLIVTGNGTEGETAFLTTFIYRKQKLEDFAVCVKPVLANVTGYRCEITLPDDLSDCEIRAVFWKDFESMKPLCSASRCLSSDAKVKNIFVDGKAIENFSQDTLTYDYNVELNRTSAPLITADPIDGGAKVIITPPTYFPGKSDIIVNSSDGSKKNIYTINYKCDTSVVSNIQHFGTVDGLKAVVVNSMQKGGYIYSDRKNMTFIDVHESILGRPFIQSALNWKNAGATSTMTQQWKDPNFGTWYTFDLKRSSMLKVIVQADYPYFENADGGWEKVSAPDLGYFFRWNQGETTFFNNPVMYQKAIVVDGDAVTVEMPNGGKDRYPYTVIIDTFYNEPVKQ